MPIWASLILATVWTGQVAASNVSYTVTFDATWSQVTHPNAYPVGAHFSPLIGGVHNDGISFWAPNGQASAGIEQMAEVGGTTSLRNEVQSAITAGTASAVIQGSGVSSPNSTAVTFQVSDDFPLVTLVTMVAPSPDWFVGVHGFDLRDGSSWKNQVTADLFPYDAGTEEGVGFSLSNPDTIPHQPIAALGFPFTASDPRLGTFTFTRDFPGRPVGDYNDDGSVNAADFTVWRNTLGQAGVNLDADGDLDGAIDPDDYQIWKDHFGTDLSGGAGAMAGADASATPEPSAAALAMFGASIVFIRRSHGRNSSTGS